MASKTAFCSLLLAFALALSGCQWLRPRPVLEPTPIQFQQLPTLEQLANAVNANTDRVRSLQTRDARINIRGVPLAITADMSYEQPRRFRFRAGTLVTGQELDLGSNDELFWFWARQNPQPALFFARHEEFARSGNRSLLPVEPHWIVDAMGLPRFDPSLRHEGPWPYPLSAKKSGELVTIRSHLPSPEGEMRKDTVVHGQYAWVMEQTVYNPRGEVIVSAKATEHEYFPGAQVALPRKVEISLPAMKFAFSVETNSYSLNQPLGNSAELFALPRDQFSSVPLVDLADPRLSPAAASPPSGAPPPGYPQVGERPRMRGLD